jgi:hypothetical protein
MENVQAFLPNDATTVTLSVSTSSARVAVQPSGFRLRYWRLYNAGDATVFITSGASTVTAAVATGMPIPAGAVEVIGSNNAYLAAITASGTATLYATPGVGI